MPITDLPPRNGVKVCVTCTEFAVKVPVFEVEASGSVNPEHAPLAPAPGEHTEILGAASFGFRIVLPISFFAAVVTAAELGSVPSPVSPPCAENSAARALDA